MKRVLWSALLLLAASCLPHPAMAAPIEENLTLLREARRFAEAYPKAVTGIILESDGRVFLNLTQERRFIYHEHRDAQFGADGQLINATLHQTLSQPYTAGPERPRPPKGFNPGRIRCDEWLSTLYGATKADLKLTSLTIGGRRVTFATGHGMDTAFTHVASGLNTLHAIPAVKPYIMPVYGQFWRTISGTKRLSAHSYGIAIDLNPDKGPYWRWAKTYPEAAIQTYPEELVSLFETNGFVWGGKWDAFDVMHFEYRPELLTPRRDALVPEETTRSVIHTQLVP